MKLKNIFLIFLLLSFSISTFSQKQKYSKVKVFLKGKDITELAKTGLNLENGVIKKNEYFIGEISEYEIGLIKKNGFQYDIIIDDISKFYKNRNKNTKPEKKKKASLPYPTPYHFKLGSMGGFFTLDEIMLELDTMHNLFPNLVSVKQSIGPEYTTEGRQQIYVKISNNPNVDENKPEILYSALTHAREPAGMQQMFFYMYFLLENYNTDPEIKYLVDNLEMYFIPCVNPDGYEYNHTTDPEGGGMWRKNRFDNGSNIFGVDLNRNYGFFWGYDDQGSSPDANTDVYRGTTGFSEKETLMMKYFCEHRDFKLIIDYHCYSNVLITPWSYQQNIETPDSAIYRRYATLLTSENNFLWGTPYQTIGYTANGTSCDWFYGEQISKPKIISFSPEAGSLDDGFWPQITNIENICQSDMGMNLYLARLALKYAQVTDLSPLFINNTNGYIKFKIKNLGLSSPSDFTVSVSAISPEINSIGTNKLFTNMQLLSENIDSISFSLNSSVQSGQQLKFIITVNNGLNSYSDTLSKIYGQPQTAFADNGDFMTNWTSTTGWNITYVASHSPSKSISDSPNTDYNTSPVNSSITLAQPINLTNVSNAYLSYWAKWDINADQDYVQIKISTNNGINWIPLTSQNTNAGIGGNQPLGQPLYDGYMGNWVQENIDLTAYAGQSIKFRFTLKSATNYYYSYDGFYFDDFTVITLPASASVLNQIGNKPELSFFPNPTTGLLHLSSSVSLNNYFLNIYNSIGKAIKKIKLTSNSDIDLSFLNTGLYFINFESNDVSLTTQRLAIIK